MSSDNSILLESEYSLLAIGPQPNLIVQPLKGRGIELWISSDAPDDTKNGRGLFVPTERVQEIGLNSGQNLYGRATKLQADVQITILPSTAGTYDQYGNLNVAVQDQYSQIVDLLLVRDLDTITIDIDTTLDGISLTGTTTGTVPVVGNYVCLKEENKFYQGRVQSVASLGGNQYELTLNTPLDYAFTTSGSCCLTSVDMNVDGSVTPVIFKLSPEGTTRGVAWDICRMIISIRDTTAMDDGKFGGGTELSEGVVFRVKYNGERHNIFTVQNNGDFRLHAYDVEYLDDTLGPSGEYGLGVRRSFNGADKNGVTIRLCNDDDPDSFQVIIQDDLTGLTNFRIVLQGHEVE